MENNPYLSDKKCKKCGEFLQKSGPYARVKREGEPAYSGPDTIYYWCLNENCSEFGRNIEDRQ